MIERLPSGRCRVSVYDPAKGVKVNVKDILSAQEMKALGARNNTFPNRNAGRKAENMATARVGEQRTLVTFSVWRERVSTEATFTDGLKESTVKTNYVATKPFAEFAGDRTLYEIEHDERILADYLEWGGPKYTVMSVRAMLNRAKTAAAGRLMKTNPLEKPGIGKSRGRSDMDPPSIEEIDAMLAIARRLTIPSYADHFDFGCHSGLRGGEIDALQWPCVDWLEREIHVKVQWNQVVGKFTSPKYGAYTIALVGRACDALRRRWEGRDSDSPFVFTNTQGANWTISSRTYWWNKVRCTFGMPDLDYYLATRHYMGWYGINVLGIQPWILAEQFGHRDHGRLLLERYGHPDRRRMRQQIREAHDAFNGYVLDRPEPTPDGPGGPGAEVIRPYFRWHDDGAAVEQQEAA